MILYLVVSQFMGLAGAGMIIFAVVLGWHGRVWLAVLSVLGGAMLLFLSYVIHATVNRLINKFFSTRLRR